MKTTVFSVFWITLAVIATIVSFSSVTSAGTDDMFKTYLEDQVQEFTLENGMKFILIERPQIPVFSAIILVGVGSVDEPPGKTGVAHVFEHMAFKGTTSIGAKDYEKEKAILERIEDLGSRLTIMKADLSADPEAVQTLAAELKAAQDEHNELIIDNAFDEIYTRNGAHFMNAGTSRDFTMYMVSLPVNRLELWARMETDRLMNPVFRQFYQERDVIMEERRMGTDNSAEGDLYEEFISTAFRVHPYGDPVIGWMGDVQNLTIEDARDFHSAYYIPDNITVAISGDIRIEELKNIAQKYFARIPRRAPPANCIPAEPPQNHIRIVRVSREDGNPTLMMAWQMPRYPDKASVALDIAAQILGSGRTSRLYRRLVEGGLAVDVSANAETLQRFNGLFSIRIKPKSGIPEKEIIDAVLEEIRGLSKNPLNQFEIDRIKKQQSVDFIRRLEANMWLAMQLAYFENITGDWRYVGTYLRDMTACSAQEVTAAAEMFLKPGNYTLAILEKSETVQEQTETAEREDA